MLTWSNTQITATVAPNAQSGVAQVQQGGVSSNTVPFNVNTATITGVSPTSGVPGTVVTIAGSGFGPAQGAGQVWLGTASGVVQSWSDTQVVAEVAIGSASGNAMILQNGVMSNPIPFAINTLQITSISPNSGAVGTSVTIMGAGFGSVQGSGIVLIGGAPGVVSSWSNTQIVATVASGAVTGVVIVEQNGVWSNAVTFTVTGSGTSMILEPNMLNMAVGDTHTIQALSLIGTPVTGLTWNTSSSNIVSLSTDNPPILTAVAPGHATITAGTASADVTVYPGALPLGTVIWSNPGLGQVASIIPAVPSPTGIADVFAVEGGDGSPVTVQAITADGTTAWTAALGHASLIPDFQGGLVVSDESGIRKLDGITGQAYPAYAPDPSTFSVGGGLVFTDGTILGGQTDLNTHAFSVIGIDPTTGAQKFSIPLAVPPIYDFFDLFSTFQVQCGTPVFGWLDGGGGSAIIAGDGYAYELYAYPEVNNCPLTWKTHLRLLRVSSSGDYSVIPIADLTAPYPYYPGQGFYGIIPEEEKAGGWLISNSDTGVLLNWSVSWDGDGYINVAGQSGTALISGTSVTPINTLPSDVIPVLQRQDGTFMGKVYDPNVPNQWDMVAFDQSGNVLWGVPNDQPQVATADNGVIGQSGITYDQNGNATGQSSLGANTSPGWVGNVLGTTHSINSGALASITAPNTSYANSFTALVGGNASFATSLLGNVTGQGTAINWAMGNWKPSDLLKQLPDLSVPAICYPASLIPVILPFGPVPTCGNINAVELLTTQSPDSIFHDIVQTLAPVTEPRPGISSPNSIMTFYGGLSFSNPVNVTGPGQILTIKLKTFPFTPFAVMTERFDPVDHVISVVTLLGHPLAGWRYWHVYSIGTNDVVIETGGYDQPAAGVINYAGYYVSQGTVRRSWMEYLKTLQSMLLNPPLGSHINHSLGGINLRSFPAGNGPLLNGYWDYFGDFTNYMLNNVCQSTTCN